MSNLCLALAYAKMGIRVFPCRPESKAPRPRNGYHDGTTDAYKIRKWWMKHPNDFIGGVCDNTFTVIDVDCGGKCPEEQKDIILSVVDEMKATGVINATTPCVQTKSGGYHYYLAPTTLFTRKINYLPAIDLLARNGYVILPDGVNYRLLSGAIDLPTLEDVNVDILESLHDKYDEVRKEVKYAIDLAKGKSPRKPRVKKNKSKQSLKSADLVGYQKSDNIDEDIDARSSILSDGMIHIDDGMLDSKLINMLFFNQEIQIKLAKFIGLKPPAIRNNTGGRIKGTLQKSILVGHMDNNESMGVRWTQVESHLLARDFSDHYGDGMYDYNVVRLFMNRMYGRNIARPSKAEWVTWFVRMLYDANIIDVSINAELTKLSNQLFAGHDKKLKAANSIFLLNSLKKLHSKYEGEFPITKSFMKAWCKEVHPNTSYNTLKDLVANEILIHTSTEKLSEKRNLFLYTVNEEITNTPNENEEETEMAKDNKSLKNWIGGKTQYKNDIGELDRVEGDKLDWGDGVEWDVASDDDDEINISEKPPT